MVSIRIDDLTYRFEKNFLEQINSEDINNIQGGIGQRWRRLGRRRRNPLRVNRQDSSATTMQSLDDRIDRWERELDETQEILDRNLNF